MNVTQETPAIEAMEAESMEAESREAESREALAPNAGRRKSGAQRKTTAKLRIFTTARGTDAVGILKEAEEHGTPQGQYLLFCRSEYLRLKAEAGKGITELTRRVDSLAEQLAACKP